MVGYLQKAPQERGLAFAERIILGGFNRNLNSALLHETKHALDKGFEGGYWLRDVLFSLGLVAGALVGYDMGRGLFDLPMAVNIIKEFIFAGVWGLSGLNIGYYLEPKEISARKFASELKNHPSHRNLIGIRPRIPRTPSSS